MAARPARAAVAKQTATDFRKNTVRSRYKRQLIQLNMNKSGLNELEWKTRDPYSLVDDSLVLLYSQFWPMWSKSRQGLGQLPIGQTTLSG